MATCCACAQAAASSSPRIRGEKPIIGVSIVTYHSSPTQVAEALSALAAQREDEIVLRIHANAPEAGELRALDNLVSQTRMMTPGRLSSSEENLGFAGAHNRLLAELFEEGCFAVVVHNPDLFLATDALGALVAAEQQLQPHAVLLGPVLELADPDTHAGTGLIDSLGIRWTLSGRHLDIGQSAPLQAPSGAPRRVAGISGACLYVPASTYRTVTEASGEFFDEDFFAYREDAELAFRAQLLGIHSYLVPSARGRHCRQLRGTQRQVSVEIDRLGVRNRFLFASKYGLGRPGLAPLVLARDAVVILGVLLRERTSLPGLRDAWQLRHAMRAKGRRVGTAAAHRK